MLYISLWSIECLEEAIPEPSKNNYKIIKTFLSHTGPRIRPSEKQFKKKCFSSDCDSHLGLHNNNYKTINVFCLAVTHAYTIIKYIFRSENKTVLFIFFKRLQRKKGKFCQLSTIYQKCNKHLDP